MIDLVKLNERLRKYTSAERRVFKVEAAELADGYHALCANAPRRTRPYLSKTRSGIAPIEISGRRREERLAMALFNRQEINFKNGSRLRLLDYQFPLKSVRADLGIGKIDLLGRYADGTLAVIEMKVEGNNEDRRIGLLEGLIYAAIVEANVQIIAAEINSMHEFQVVTKRPKILLVAPPEFWSDFRCHPPGADMKRLAAEVMAAVPIDISLWNLDGLDQIGLGLDGSPPAIHSDVILSPVLG